MKNFFYTVLFLTSICLLMTGYARDSQTAAADTGKTTAFSHYYSGKATPPDGKTLLAIGQDLYSIFNYVDSGYFPPPTATVAYISVYDLVNGQAPYPYGGLGVDPGGKVIYDVNWGAGPLNAYNCGMGYENSALILALYMTEEFFPGGLSAIANGQYNAAIDRLGDFIKEIGQAQQSGPHLMPVYVRIGYEFDGRWNIGYDKHAEYKAAYRHIVNRLRAKAPNFVSVWQSSTSPVDDFDEQYHENLWDWYPGADYVDWMGMSYFLTSYSWKHQPSQHALSDELLDLARAEGKPVMICESTPQGYDLSRLTKSNINTPYDGAPGQGTVSKSAQQIWNEWFKIFFDYIHANEDVIRGVTYINARWDDPVLQPKWSAPYNEGYWGDSRVEVNSTIRNKWINEMNKQSWLHGSADLAAVLNGGSTPPAGDPYVTSPSSVTASSDTNGNSQARVQFKFPATGYRIGSWGTVNQSGSTFTVNVKPYQNTSGTQTTVSHTYDLGQLASGSYTFQVKVWGTLKKSQSFTVDNQGGSGTDIPGLIETQVGAIANGQNKNWTVTTTQAGYYKVLVTSNSPANSQLIQVELGGESSGLLAIDAGKTLTAYINKSFNAGQALILKITAGSGQVSISKVEVVKWM